MDIMSATFVLYKRFGTNLTKSTSFVSETSIGSYDTSAPYTSMPVGIPDVATTYSYEIVIEPKCTNPPLTMVNNLRMWYQYSDPYAGVKLYGGGTAKGAIFTPTNNKSTNATYDMSQYGTIGDSISIPGQASAVNSVLGRMVLQNGVNNSAVYSGGIINMIVHFAYDEA